MLNEFRQDPVTGDWVLFAATRAGRPHQPERQNFFQTKQECPFEGNFAGQEKTGIIWNHGNPVPEDSPDWTIRVVKNKFPLVLNGMCDPTHAEGPFEVGTATGAHELIVTRDHDRRLPQLTPEELAEVIRMYKYRYTELAQDPCTKYVSIFHNHGSMAGASIYHNHSQIVSMPLVPSLIVRSVQRAKEYLATHGTPIYDALLDFQIAGQKRVIAENDAFVAFCPYVSRTAHEVRIFPKTEQASFGELVDERVPALADVLGRVLEKLHTRLNDPDFIFFIRTAPVNDEISHREYRWHLEIMPRDSVMAGLELGTNVFVNTKDPDEAAQDLRT